MKRIVSAFLCFLLLTTLVFAMAEITWEDWDETMPGHWIRQGADASRPEVSWFEFAEGASIDDLLVQRREERFTTLEDDETVTTTLTYSPQGALQMKLLMFFQGEEPSLVETEVYDTDGQTLLSYVSEQYENAVMIESSFVEYYKNGQPSLIHEQSFTLNGALSVIFSRSLSEQGELSSASFTSYTATGEVEYVMNGVVILNADGSFITQYESFNEKDPELTLISQTTYDKDGQFVSYKEKKPDETEYIETTQPESGDWVKRLMDAVQSAE